MWHSWLCVHCAFFKSISELYSSGRSDVDRSLQREEFGIKGLCCRYKMIEIVHFGRPPLVSIIGRFTMLVDLVDEEVIRGKHTYFHHDLFKDIRQAQ